MQNDKLGTLYVVATPIGNLQDITLRAIETLKIVSRIAAEDTRHAVPLLKHFSIHKPTISIHEHNEHERIDEILGYLGGGEDIALISDAGTPLINDPGFRLVRAAKSKGLKVVPIPGPSALITALSASGLPTDRFTFEGFLPVKNKACLDKLESLANEERTMIFYEAPHRLIQTLENIKARFGEKRQACVARELTKIYESIKLGDLQTLLDYYLTHSDECRGEIVILVAGIEKVDTNQSLLTSEKVLDILLEELPVKQAVALASKITGERKNELYDLALRKRSKE